MEKYKLTTIFTSNSPLDCHILKGRLETEGLDCFIFDEYYISVDPFKAVALRGVKLKVPSDQIDYGLKIVNSIQNNKLIDSDGEYDCKTIFENEFNRQNEIMYLKNQIRNNPLLLSNPEALKMHINNDWIDDTELNKLISEETEFDNLTRNFRKPNWKDLFYDFFGSDRNVFKYFAVKTVNYFLEKEMVDNYCKADLDIIEEHCPNCNSNNVKFSNAMDFKWDILFLLLSLLVRYPFPLIRAKYHCFDCGFNFSKREMQQ